MVSTCTPAHADVQNVDVTPVSAWVTALHHLVEALKLLDESDAPPELGAHVDLAIQRLRKKIALSARDMS